MTILKFEGVVEMDYDEIKIDGRDVVAEVNAVDWPGKVTIAFADAAFDGELYATHGYPGYSEWTPGEPASLEVGKHRVSDRLWENDGLKVTMWVADEPVNVLE